jgi:hypothetical protein
MSICLDTVEHKRTGKKTEILITRAGDYSGALAGV